MVFFQLLIDAKDRFAEYLNGVWVEGGYASTWQIRPKRLPFLRYKPWYRALDQPQKS